MAEDRLALIKRQTAYPTKDEWAIMQQQASIAVKSRLLPSNITTPEQAIIVALKGRELGLGMMESFESVYRFFRKVPPTNREGRELFRRKLEEFNALLCPNFS